MAFFLIIFVTSLILLLRMCEIIIMKMSKMKDAKAQAVMKSKHCEIKSTLNPKITI